MTKPDSQSTNQQLPGHREFRQLYDHSPIGVLAIDARGVIRFANAAAPAYTGLEKKIMLGQSVFSFYKDTATDQVNNDKLLKLEEITDQEFIVVNPASQMERWVLISSQIHRDSKGETQTYLFIRDISILKKKEKLFSYLTNAAEELAKARDTKSALEKISELIVPKFATWFTIDILKDGKLELLALKHEDPKKIEWARQYRNNYPPDPNGNAGAAVVLKTGNAAIVPVVTEQMIAALVTNPVQLELVKQIGLQSVIIAPLYDKDAITGVANFISSAPGRHFDGLDLEFAQNFASLIGLALENARLNEDADSELERRKQREEQFRFLTDAIPHKIWTSGPDGRATYYNRGWYDYTHINGFEALRENIWDIMHPDDRAIAAVAWPKAIESGKGMEMEHRFRRFDGVYRWHLTRFSGHKNEEGQIELWVGTSTDINEQKISQQGMAAMNEELGAMNEELASANEEMTAVNEEMAATNEELRETQANLQQAIVRLAESSERQARLAAIVNTSDDVIVSKTLMGIITSWNGAAERMFGYKQDEAIGKHISLIIPPARLQEEEYIIGQIRIGQKVNHFETVRMAKDGHLIPLSLSISPIIDEDGNIIGASKIARDISTQVAARDAGKRYTERLENMNLVIKAVSEEMDLNKILQKVTDATTALTGAKFGAFFYNTVDESGESYMLFTLSGAPREAFEKFGMPRNTAVFGPTFSGEGVVRVDDITKDPRYGKNAPHHGMPKGHLPVVSYLAVPVISRSGAVIGGLFFGHPEPAKFTKDHESLVIAIAGQSAIGIDNAKLYEQVKNLNEKKDEFIGLASHELKTPLTSVNGYLQIIRLHKTDEKSQKFVDRAIYQVQKLTTLVNDLLDVSKIEAGKLQLTIEAFDILDVIKDAIELIQYTSDKYHILFETNLKSCMVNADRQRIEQVLINLLSNAIKYSPGGDKMIVMLSSTKKEVKVSVKDFGVGIPGNKLTQIFSRFYRIEETNPNISGLGIGLYLCHEIITRHNGKLWVESEIGVGSIFYFSLPLG